LFVYHTFEHADRNSCISQAATVVIAQTPSFAATAAAQGLAGHVEVVGDGVGGDAPVRRYDLRETGEPEVGSLAPVTGVDPRGKGRASDREA
jgi:hypothetical protein